MPKLPSAADLGASRAPDVIGPVGRLDVRVPDTTASGRATAQLGRAVMGIGDAFAQIDQKLTEARQASQLTDAVGRATGEIGELEIRYQADQDFRTSTERFTEQAKLIGDKYEQSIDDPAVRSAFQTRYRDIATAKRLSVLQHAVKQEGDYNVAALDRNIDIYAANAANAANLADREVVINQFRIDLANMVRANWITDVDAGNRERAFLAKLDQATVLRDMAINPYATGIKLSGADLISTPAAKPKVSASGAVEVTTPKVAGMDITKPQAKAVTPQYAAHLDPVMRERLIDQSFRKAEQDRREAEAVEARRVKELGDDLMKEALTRLEAGTLDQAFLQRVKPYVSPAEWHTLIKGKPDSSREDDPTVFARLEGLLQTNPEAASREAFAAHRSGRIKNATLQSVNSRSRDIERQEGPRSQYERTRSFITNAIKPPEGVTDYAASARYALAIREFDEFNLSGKRTDKELSDKGDAILKHYSTMDMVNLARETGMGAQPTPQEQIDKNLAEAARLMDLKEKKKITEDEFKRRMNRLNKSTEAAEKALEHGGRK